MQGFDGSKEVTIAIQERMPQLVAFKLKRILSDIFLVPANADEKEIERREAESDRYLFAMLTKIMKQHPNEGMVISRVVNNLKPDIMYPHFDRYEIVIHIYELEAGI